MLIGMCVLFFVSLFVCLLRVIFIISEGSLKSQNSIPKCRYKLKLDDCTYYGDEYSIDGDFIKFHALAYSYLWGGAFSGIHLDFEPCIKTIEINKYVLERNENGFDFNAMKY